MAAPRIRSKSDFIQMLRRANYDPALIDEIASKLPDPIDLDRDSAILRRYGLTRDVVIGRAGGSP
jgi:hypothetical protein